MTFLFASFVPVVPLRLYFGLCHIIPHKTLPLAHSVFSVCVLPRSPSLSDPSSSFLLQSEEDLKLKEDLTLMVERAQDADVGVQKLALE